MNWKKIILVCGRVFFMQNRFYEVKLNLARGSNQKKIIGYT